MSDDQMKIDKAIELLKNSGIRITPQRHAVLEYLILSHTHPTADEIYKALEGRFSNMSVATVYNNLRMFKKTGMVKELTYGDASSRFDFSTKPHYHVICKQCGKIVDFFYPGLDEVEDLAAKVTGFVVSSHRLEVYGLCPACQKANVHHPSDALAVGKEEG
ncbi:MAG: peroxide-responsive transcriptional repressor PerR [Sporolactobacillus sp.]